MPRPKRPLGRDGAPLGQRTGSPLFVDLASDEMALLIEDPMGEWMDHRTICSKWYAKGDAGRRGCERTEPEARTI